MKRILILSIILSITYSQSCADHPTLITFKQVAESVFENDLSTYNSDIKPAIDAFQNGQIDETLPSNHYFVKMCASASAKSCIGNADKWEKAIKALFKKIKQNSKDDIPTSLRVLYKAKQIVKLCGIKEDFKFIPSFKKFLFKIYERDETDFSKKFSGNEYTTESGEKIQVDTIEQEDLEKDFDFTALTKDTAGRTIQDDKKGPMFDRWYGEDSTEHPDYNRIIAAKKKEIQEETDDLKKKKQELEAKKIEESKRTFQETNFQEMTKIKIKYLTKKIEKEKKIRERELKIEKKTKALKLEKLNKRYKIGTQLLDNKLKYKEKKLQILKDNQKQFLDKVKKQKENVDKEADQQFKNKQAAQTKKLLWKQNTLKKLENDEKKLVDDYKNNKQKKLQEHIKNEEANKKNALIYQNKIADLKKSKTKDKMTKEDKAQIDEFYQKIASFSIPKKKVEEKLDQDQDKKIQDIQKKIKIQKQEIEKLQVKDLKEDDKKKKIADLLKIQKEEETASKGFDKKKLEQDKAAALEKFKKEIKEKQDKNALQLEKLQKLGDEDKLKDDEITELGNLLKEKKNFKKFSEKEFQSNFDLNYQVQLDAKKRNIKDIQKQLDQLQKTPKEQQDDLIKIEKEKIDQKNQLIINSIQKQIKDAEAQVLKIGKDKEEAKKQDKTPPKKIAQLEATILKNEKKSLERYKKRIDKFEAQLQKYQDKLKDNKRQTKFEEKVQAKIKKIQTQIDNLDTKISKKETKLKKLNGSRRRFLSEAEDVEETMGYPKKKPLNGKQLFRSINKARIKITLGFINLLRGVFCNLFISVDKIFTYYENDQLKLDSDSVKNFKQYVGDGNREAEIAISEIPIVMSKYFNYYSNPNTCFNVFKDIMALIQTDKPCGDNGDCYEVELDLTKNPIQKISDSNKEDSTKDQAWQQLETTVQEQQQLENQSPVGIGRDAVPFDKKQDDNDDKYMTIVPDKRNVDAEADEFDNITDINELKKFEEEADKKELVLDAQLGDEKGSKVVRRILSTTYNLIMCSDTDNTCVKAYVQDDSDNDDFVLDGVNSVGECSNCIITIQETVYGQEAIDLKQQQQTIKNQQDNVNNTSTQSIMIHFYISQIIIIAMIITALFD